MKEKIIYYEIKMKTVSPLCIGSGEDEFSDHDVFKDKEGNIIIPATSIAGVMRHSLNTETANIMFGTADGTTSSKSPVFISDGTVENYVIRIRDGIKLNDEKITEDTGKYDYEIIENGAVITFRVEIADDRKFSYEKEFDRILKKIDEGIIRFGFKSNRGTGKIQITEVKKKIFDKSNYKEYLEFKNDFSSVPLYNDWKKAEYISTFNKITVDLTLCGAISIRTYTKADGEPDFEHIKNNGHSVIPGTSWNGVIRSFCRKLIKDEDIINNNFGFISVEKGKNSESVASKIIFGESIIEGGNDLVQTRTKIDRFTGGAMDKALFTESVHVGGKTSLQILMKNDVNFIVKNAILCAIEDIGNGYLTIGGMTGIGRGRFKVDKVEIDGIEWDKNVNIFREVENV